jgi:hypothetical protein
MKGSRFSTLARVLFVLLLLAVLALSVPGHAQAASPFINIVSVKGGESATVHATGLPAGMSFTARMDKATTTAASGTIVGVTTSASDGTLDATYAIPAALKSEAAITIRIDAATGGWYAYNLFSNQTRTAVPTSATTPTAAPTTTSTKMYIEILAVEKNNRITVSAVNFPANIDFRVRVGPYYNFGHYQQTVVIINSGKGGAFLFNLNLPALVKDVSFVTVRLDSITGDKHFVAYNAFTNENEGTVVANPTLPTPTPTPSSQAGCQILSVTPTQSMAVNNDFDAVWEVKNTGSKAWDNHEIDLRYQSGDKFYKFSGVYDLPRLVNPGETVKLVADMLAPSKTGTYSTVFVLVGDHGVVCTLPLTITVK